MARKPTDTVQLKLRFPEALRRKLEKDAAKHSQSMNAEIVRRLDESFKWDQGEEAVKRLVADSEQALKRGFEAALQHAGYQRIVLDQGNVWAEPGMNIARMSVSVDAAAVVRAMEAEFAGVLARAIAKVSKEGDKK
jgi:hypothetical protein